MNNSSAVFIKNISFLTTAKQIKGYYIKIEN